MRYAMLINGAIQYAPRTIRDNQTVTYNPTEEALINLGYKPVYEEEEPVCEDGYYCKPKYSETDKTITIEWEVVEKPYTDDSDYAEIGKIMMGVI